MPHDLEELPLFPLDAVLFPHAHLRVHVFEERYQEMIRTCVDEERPFGIVLIREGSETGNEPVDPYLVGTFAHIVQIDQYDDGAMDVQVKGEGRFRVRQLDEDSRPYLVGHVEKVLEHDIEETAENQELIARAKEDAEVLIQRLFSRQEFSVQVVFPPEPMQLSFTIANLLQIENLTKQRLLESTDTMERFEEMLPILEMQLIETAPVGEALPGSPTFYQLRAKDLSEWINPN